MFDFFHFRSLQAEFDLKKGGCYVKNFRNFEDGWLQRLKGG